MIWAFFSRRIRLWLLLAVGAPLLGGLLRKISDAMEQRGGETTLTRGLRTGSEKLASLDRKGRRKDRAARR